MTTEQKLYLSTQLIRIGQLTEIARILTELLTKESFVRFGTLDGIKGIRRNLEQANSRLVGMLKPESQAISSSQVLDEQSVLQTCTLIDMLMAMDRPHRERLEAEADRLYLEYSKQAA